MGQQRTVTDAMYDLWKKGIKPKDDARALINSPTFTGEPKAPTPDIDDDSNRIATTAYVVELINNLVGSAPETLNTLAKLAAALKNNPDTVQNILTELGKKLDTTTADATYYKKGYSVGNLLATMVDGGNNSLSLTSGSAYIMIANGSGNINVSCTGFYVNGTKLA